MGTVWRTADRRLLRDVGALSAAAFAIGVSFGAIAVAAGLPSWLVLMMSLLVFAGGSQFLAVGLLAAGSPAGALLGGLLLNARHLPFGLVLGGRSAEDQPGPTVPVIGRGWLARLIGSHLMIDESVAFALAQTDPHRRRAAYWLTGAALFVIWAISTGLGTVLGNAVGDPATLGLDAAFPAGMLALLWPTLRGDPQARRVALAGGAVALVATPLLPAGAPVLLALAGLLALLIPRRPRRPRLPRRSRGKAAQIVGFEDELVLDRRGGDRRGGDRRGGDRGVAAGSPPEGSRS